MSLLTRIDLVDPLYYATTKTKTFASLIDADDLLIDELSLSLDLLTPKPSLFDSITDLIQPPPFRRITLLDETTPFGCYYTKKRITQIDQTSPAFGSYGRRRVLQIEGETPSSKLKVKSLSKRVAELERRFERVVRDGKYTCTAEIAGVDFEKKYKWTAEIKGGKKKEEKWTAEVCGKKGNKYKWTTEIKGVEDDEVECSGIVSDVKKDKKSNNNKNKNNKESKSKTRVVEIEDNNGVDHHGALVLKQAFAKHSRATKNAKGKKKELSPQDAAVMIQMAFRAYLIRRSMALRALRELAVAKTKLKELRALFNNFSYRRHVSQDPEECQKFSEKIIVLLLTVDAIEGVDLMVRGAKRSMIDELEAMLDVVDPQPCGKSLSMRRRTFDMPDAVIRKEIAEGVAQVVQMLDGEENSSSTFEACL